MLIRIYLNFFRKYLIMKNKIFIGYIFLLFSFFVSTPIYAKTELESLCETSMAHVSVLQSNTKNIFKIKREINKEYKGVKLKRFLKNEWLPEIRENKAFTPNNFYAKKNEYIRKCVQSMRAKK
tara:strand:- start:3281 stop:3649 length:369 start_codon:yes stop_codon:yes gene_type:complete